MRPCILQLPAHPHDCPYLAGRRTAYEHYLVESLGQEATERLLARGFRSFGAYWFRPGGDCCGECLPLRVPVERFRPSKSQRRVWRRGVAAGIELRWGRPVFRDEKHRLYHEHKQRFGDGESLPRDEFIGGFYGGGDEALELEMWLDGGLVGCGLLLRAGTVLSSTYFFYGERVAPLSPGTFSALAEIAKARELGATHYHLGFFIADNRSMRYKAAFLPCEVLVGEEGAEEWAELRDAQGTWRPGAPALRRRPDAPVWKQAVGVFDQPGMPAFVMPTLDDLLNRMEAGVEGTGGRDSRD
jgi:arginine-tRNA-protein transferase